MAYRFLQKSGKGEKRFDAYARTSGRGKATTSARQTTIGSYYSLDSPATEGHETRNLQQRPGSSRPYARAPSATWNQPTDRSAEYVWDEPNFVDENISGYENYYQPNRPSTSSGRGSFKKYTAPSRSRGNFISPLMKTKLNRYDHPNDSSPFDAYEDEFLTDENWEHPMAPSLGHNFKENVSTNKANQQMKPRSIYPTYNSNNNAIKKASSQKKNQSLKVFTVAVPKLQTVLANRIPGEVIFELFGILASVINADSNVSKSFVLRGQKNGAVTCVFYEIDRTLQLGKVGEWHRCIGLTKPDGLFQCLSVRTADSEELLHLDPMLCLSSKYLAMLFSGMK